MNKRLGFVLVSLAVAFPLAAGEFENLSRRCATKDHDEKEREQVTQENSRFKKAWRPVARRWSVPRAR